MNLPLELHFAGFFLARNGENSQFPSSSSPNVYSRPPLEPVIRSRNLRKKYYIQPLFLDELR